MNGRGNSIGSTTTHLPLALKVPGLRKFEISQGDVVTVEGALDVLFVCTLYFDDFAALDAAMRTPDFAAVRDDGPKFAKPGNIDAFVLEDAAVLSSSDCGTARPRR